MNGSASRKRDPAVTSQMMSAVRRRDTAPELVVRRALYRRGWRYRVDYNGAQGRPDIAFIRARVAVFIDGDFWHGNAWRLRGLSSLEDLFPNNRRFWVDKIRANERRDRDVTRSLLDQGWAVIRIWESEVADDLEVCVARIESVIRDRLTSSG